MSIARINTNIQSMQALANLQNANNRLATRQLRLSTGLQINKAEDDSAGYAIARKLESTNRGLSQALSNISDGKSMLTVAEGGLSTVMDIVQEMKQKATQAANGSLSDNEREDIQEELENLSSEVDEILGGTDFNGDTLFTIADDGSSVKITFNFQVGAEKDDAFTASIGGLASLHDLTGGTAQNSKYEIDVSNTAGATAAIDDLEDIINVLSDRLASLGSDQKRLSFKQQNVETAKTNYEAARSQIEDADFAKEQMEIAKLQILQQTGTAALSQANAAPQAVLSLVGGQ
jgi:flagellin